MFFDLVAGGQEMFGKHGSLSAFVKDKHRLCVALTRSRCGLIIVGNGAGIKAGVAKSKLVEMVDILVLPA